MISLSIIIPVFNEMGVGHLEKNLKLLAPFENIEVICVDSMSSDGTFEMIQVYEYVKCYRTDSNLRAQRLNIGIRESQGHMILLCHPRSLLSNDGIKYLLKEYSKLEWGGFTHRFDKDSLGLQFTSWYSNQIRAKICSNLYLDHCIFIKKDLVDYFGRNNLLEKVSIFEDSLLSFKLRTYSSAKILDFEVKTSSIRFDKNGFFYQGLLNQVLKVLFFIGVSEDLMNKFYERSLSLNSKY